MRVLRALYNFAQFEYKNAQDKPIFLYNPVQILSHKRQWNHVPRKQTRLTRSEIPKLLSGLNTIRETADTFLFAVCDFVEIALFTGLRKSELLNLKWEQINLEERTFRILETKNGDALELPMADHLYSIFERRKTITNNEYVFQADNDYGYIREPKKAIQTIIDTTEVSFTLHDLRRTFTSTAELLRVGTYTIKRLLNHKTGRNDVTAGYTILTAEELRPFGKLIEEKIIEEK
jgi:integrase